MSSRGYGILGTTLGSRFGDLRESRISVGTPPYAIGSPVDERSYYLGANFGVIAQRMPPHRSSRSTKTQTANAHPSRFPVSGDVSVRWEGEVGLIRPATSFRVWITSDAKLGLADADHRPLRQVAAMVRLARVHLEAHRRTTNLSGQRRRRRKHPLLWKTLRNPTPRFGPKSRRI